MVGIRKSLLHVTELGFRYSPSEIPISLLFGRNDVRVATLDALAELLTVFFTALYADKITILLVCVE